MTLDNAIEHCEEKAKTAECKECREEHRQLVGWLSELKIRRNSQSIVHARWVRDKVGNRHCTVCSNCGSIIPSDTAIDALFTDDIHFCYWCGARMDLQEDTEHDGT